MTTRVAAEPLFRQIVEDLKRLIDEGNLPEHAPLPSERVVAEHHDVSRMTARRALEAIEAEGLAYSKDRQGRFVSPRRLNYDVNSMESFAERAARDGIVVEAERVSTRQIPASSERARALQVEPGTALVETCRLFRRDGHATFLETETVILAHCEALGAAPPQEQRYSPLGHMADIVIRMRAMEPEEADLLGAMPHQPGIEQLQQVRDAEGLLICHVRQIWRGELAQFSARALLAE